MNLSWPPSCGKISSSVTNRVLGSLAHYRIQIREKYLSCSASTGERYSLFLQDYMAHEAWAKEKRLVCPEDYSAPFQELVSKEVSNNAIDLDGANVDRVSIHSAYGGSVTPMHFDWDNTRIQHLCLSGTRRLWLCPPGPHHILPAAGNSVLADFEEMSAEQRERTLRQFGATKFEMKPGEFIRFTSIWWHLVEYTQASVAISVRTEIDPLLRPLTILPRSPELQYVLYGLISASSEKRIAVTAMLVRSFLCSLTEGDRSFTVYEASVRQAQEDLELETMNPDPWIVPKAFQQQSYTELQHVSCKSDKVRMKLEQTKLCQEWLFGHWPECCPLSSADMSGLADLMACFLAHADELPITKR